MVSTLIKFCLPAFLWFSIVNKSTMESDMSARRRDSSIKKILSNQPLEKQEYVGKKSNQSQNNSPFIS
jgi:hypothetical protein